MRAVRVQVRVSLQSQVQVPYAVRHVPCLLCPASCALLRAPSALCMRGVLRSRSVWAHSRACAPACTPSTDSPHLPTQARAPALSPALRCPRRHAHLPAHQRVRADRAPARPHHHLPSAPRRADHQEGAGEHRRVQSHGDLRVAARDATCSSRRRVSGWVGGERVASAAISRGGLLGDRVFMLFAVFRTKHAREATPCARALQCRAHR